MKDAVFGVPYKPDCNTSTIFIFIFFNFITPETITNMVVSGMSIIIKKTSTSFNLQCKIPYKYTNQTQHSLIYQSDKTKYDDVSKM